MAFKIFLSPPNMYGKEQKYVQEAFDTNWIAPYGPQITEFENEMAQYIGQDAAIACTSGTAAIHLALRWYGVGPGDLVFCSDFTFIGTCNPVLYQGAIPVFIDSEEDSWNMSPVALEKAFLWAQEQGKMPKAVIIVDLYGESADWDRLLPICQKYGVPVIEDAAEAVGSTYKGKKCGSFGEINILSFNGNKILTTSGGGMALSNNVQAIDKMRFWATQAREPVIWYEHKEYGYNYRLSNVCAAIGRGQLDAIDQKLNSRAKIHQRYVDGLKELPVKIKESKYPGANYWLSLLIIQDETIHPTQVVAALQNAQIESRPAWKPLHMQPIFKNATFFAHDDETPVSEKVFQRALCLPSGDGMTEEQQNEVIAEVIKAFRDGSTLEKRELRLPIYND